MSTAKQDISDLGLQAQRAAVQADLNGGSWKIHSEVAEVETGKDNARPQLAKALRLCRLHNAALLVAKFDRLSRNVAFLANLMESTLRNCAGDMSVDETRLHMMAVFARHKADDLLALHGSIGCILEEARWQARITRRWVEITAEGREVSAVNRATASNEWAKDALLTIEDVKPQRASSLREIAAVLNENKVPTRAAGSGVRPR